MVTPVDHKKTDPPAQQEASTILYGLEQTLAAAALAREGGDQNTLVDNALLQQPSCEEDAEASSLR